MWFEFEDMYLNSSFIRCARAVKEEGYFVDENDIEHKNEYYQVVLSTESYPYCSKFYDTKEEAQKVLNELSFVKLYNKNFCN